MSIRLLSSLTLGSVFGSYCHAALPVFDGERLTYRVSWAIVPGAGEIKVVAKKELGPDGARLAVTATTTTRRLARMLLPFDAEAKSIFDLNTGHLLSLQETSSQRSKRSAHRVTFDYTSRQATYIGSKSADQPQLLVIPAGDPTDLIMGLLQTRSWNLPLGEKQDALVLFANDFYELTIYHTRNEQVRTPLGTFDTMVLEPRMEKTAPKGMFKRGSTVRVWIAQEKRRLPVKFEVEFKIGTGTASLEAYEGPTAPTASFPDAPNPRP
jgi:hypothetical protein